MTTRHSAGAPAGTGGQFKAEQRPAADFDLPAETPISAEAAYAQFSALVQKVGATGRGVDRAAAVTLAALVRGAHPAARYVEVEPSEQGDYFLPSGPVFDGDHNAVDAELSDDRVVMFISDMPAEDIRACMVGDRLDLDALLAHRF